MALDSRFIKKTLMPDEKVVAEGVFPFAYTLCAYFWFLFCVLLGGVMQTASVVYLKQPFGIGVVFMTVVGFGIFMSMMMKRWTTEIFLTNHRLIYKRGLFNIEIDEVDVEQLASDKVHQSLVGRMLGYGVVQIRCVEADDIWLPDISHPYSFRNAIENAKRAYREEFMKGGRLYRHGRGNHRPQVSHSS